MGLFLNLINQWTFILGILMTLAWLLFATCGIFMSRYMKPFLKKKIAGKDAWFRVSSSYIFRHIYLVLLLTNKFFLLLNSLNIV